MEERCAEADKRVAQHERRESACGRAQAGAGAEKQ
jgi:hypothetical protein